MSQETLPQGTHVSFKRLLSLQSLAHHLPTRTWERLSHPIAGHHVSQKTGRGMSYAGSRLYAEGDDVRYMDWRVTARLGKTYVKTFHEEQEKPVSFLLDLSPSLFFGTQSAFKSVVACEVFALLAWSALQAQHSVSVQWVSPSGKQHFSPLTKDTEALFPIFKQLEALTPRFGNNTPNRLISALSTLQTQLAPGGILIVISDFLNLSENTQSLLKALNAQVLLVSIFDAMETTLPAHALLPIFCEEKHFSMDTHDEHFRQNYQQHFLKRQSVWKNIAQAKQGVFLPCPTGQSLSSIASQLGDALA